MIMLSVPLLKLTQKKAFWLRLVTTMFFLYITVLAGNTGESPFNGQNSRGHPSKIRLKSPAPKPNKYYVSCDAGAAGDGSCWEKAFQTIAAALAVAVDKDVIWIKKGIYPLTTQLVIDKAVFIYGGLNGDEAFRESKSREVKVWNNNLAFIDGQGITRCLVITANAHLENLAIINGYKGNEAENQGGGIFISGCSPTLRHCQLINNQADYAVAADLPGLGGAIFLENGSPYIYDSLFEANIGGAKAALEYMGHGGAIYIKNGCAVLHTCRFTNNQADGFGGAIYGNARIEHCIFSGNEGFMGGGAVYSTEYNQIKQSLFLNNRTEYRGGGFSGRGSIAGCRFHDNTAGDAGGALYLIADTVIHSSYFLVNNVTNNYGKNLGGGAIFVERDADIKTINSVFARNQVGQAEVAHGGACYNQGYLQITNCTFWGNWAYTAYAGLSWFGRGGAIYHNRGGKLTVTNSILWENIGLPAEVEDNNSPIDLSYCNIDQAGFPGSNNNFRQDPLFVAPIDNNFRLRKGSPCIDTGFNKAVAGIRQDYDGKRRITKATEIQPAVVDLGADEYTP